MEIQTILILLGIGLMAGVFSGAVGIGGGVIIVPALVFFLGLSQHEAQGASLGLFLMPVGFLAAYNYYKTGNLDFRLPLTMALAFVVGAFVGAKIALAIDQLMLKRVFGLFMLLIALRLIFVK